MRDRFEAALAAGMDFHKLPTMQLIATVQAASVAAHQNSLRVLDLGGQFGGHKYWVEAATGLSCQWAVVETPALVGASNDSDSLKFFSSPTPAIQWLQRIDLLNLSGVIQFLENAPSMIGSILKAKPRFISVTRTPLSTTDMKFDVQVSRLFDNGFGPVPAGYVDCEIRYPRILWPDATIKDLFSGYRLAWSTCEGPTISVDGDFVQEGHVFLFEIDPELPS
ncbi:hypothetical protein [Nostoc linckia]|uniref:hypothetical protein n=1 Tax=Nostoc linckia TaxID=92942 RepID=UPI00117FD4BA|nr:hypothetical protein [Nostoc linckia]